MGWYHSEIATTEHVRLNRVKNWAKSAFWMVCLEVDWFDEARRDAFMQALKARGIDSRPYFCTMSSMPMYRAVAAAGLGTQGADRSEPAVLLRADETRSSADRERM